MHERGHNTLTEKRGFGDGTSDTMSKLKCLVVADPLADVATLIADFCGRLAEQRFIASTSAELAKLTRELHPEVVVVALELTKPPALEVIAKLTKEQPSLLVIATYRELSILDMEKLERAGVHDLLPQPVDVTEVFRAASRHFAKPFRRHDRIAATIDVFRADGVLVGRTRDLSEGGMLIDALQPMKNDESLLLELALGDGVPKSMRVRCRVLAVEGTQPARVTARIQFERLWGPEHRRLADHIRRTLDTDKP